LSANSVTREDLPAGRVGPKGDIAMSDPALIGWQNPVPLYASGVGRNLWQFQ